MKMIRRANNDSGFTLIEIAIVLLVITILLGYTVAMFPIQQELKQYRQADREMDDIIEHLIAFAQVNGRLPCPDTGTLPGILDGQEDIALAGGCVSYFAWVPRATLGMTGDIGNIAANNGNLLDPWGLGYGYHVSNVDTGPNGNVDLVTPNDIQVEGLVNVNTSLGPPSLPGLRGLIVCNNSPALAANDTACLVGPGITTIINNAAVVIVSLGKDGFGGAAASNIQAENVDGFQAAVPTDFIYTSAPHSETTGAEYDDIVKWISPHLLFSKMIEADQLP